MGDSIASGWEPLMGGGRRGIPLQLAAEYESGGACSLPVSPSPPGALNTKLLQVWVYTPPA